MNQGEMLSMALLILSVAVTVLLASIPLLAWRMLRAEQAIDHLDDSVAELMKLAALTGPPLPPGIPQYVPGKNEAANQPLEQLK
jgi:hypothetical protein